MKKWIWQFKTFLSNNHRFPSKAWCIAGATVILAAFVSCRLHQQDQSEESVAPPGASSPIAAFAAAMFSPSEPQYIKIIGSEDGGKGLIAEVDIESCAMAQDATPGGLKIKIKLVSVFGPESLTFDMNFGPKTTGVAPEKPTATARVGSQSVTFQHRWNPGKAWLEKVCAVRDEDVKDRSVIGERDFVAHASEWIAQVVPDCELKEVHEDGWRCSLSPVTPDLAAREIEQLKRVMVSTWSRQPYVMARRATIGLSLAKALSVPADQKAQALDRFCKVVSHSQNAELPLVMTSSIWRKTACENKNTDRFEAAAVGLTKSMNELELLRRLFESSSKLGVLTVRIPRVEAPSSNFIVSLTPDADVAANLAKETSNIWVQRGASGTQAPRACWHPIFSETPEMLFLAQQLDLAGDAPRTACATTAQAGGETHEAILAKYLAESVTSDTDFLLINGEAKMLRLPTGSYSYTIHAAPDHVAEFSMAETPATEEEGEDQAPVVEEQSAIQGPSTTGKITWESRRPRAFIRTW